METKHTLGPWEPLRNGIEIQSEEGRHAVFACVNGVPVPICEVHPTMHSEHDDPAGEYVISNEEGLANLRLIAAAPELLEQLKKLVAEYESLPHSLGYEYTHLESARAAIAKATGQ
jgi:hypothetical protein